MIQLPENTNVYTDTTPLEEERVFDHSDADEMSDNSTNPVPRGIVNPNYPGFQHLAHTLQVKFHLEKETFQVFKLYSLQRHKGSPSCYKIHRVGSRSYWFIFFPLSFS